MTAQPDHYAVLGIPRGADGAAIREAYLAKVKDFHPDRSTAPHRLDHFLRLQQAYACLRDASRRAAYDDAMITDQSRQYRRVRRAKRRLRKLDHRLSTARLQWAAVVIVFAGGTLAASAFYLASN